MLIWFYDNFINNNAFILGMFALFTAPLLYLLLTLHSVPKKNK